MTQEDVKNLKSSINFKEIKSLFNNKYMQTYTHTHARAWARTHIHAHTFPHSPGSDSVKDSACQIPKEVCLLLIQLVPGTEKDRKLLSLLYEAGIPLKKKKKQRQWEN